MKALKFEGSQLGYVRKKEKLSILKALPKEIKNALVSKSSQF